MRSRLVVVAHVGSHNSPQMRFPEHDDMIEALPAQCSDYPLDIRILPGTVRRNDYLLNADGLHPFPERQAVHSIPVADNEARGLSVAERFHHLLRCPLGRRVLGHIEMQDPASIMREHNKDEQNAENVAVGTVKKSIDTISPTWLSRNVLQV